MAINVLLPRFKLNGTQKKKLIKYFMGTATLLDTAKAIGVTPTRLYVMQSEILRRMVTSGTINIEEVLKDY